jgi:hypothetical protein
VTFRALWRGSLRLCGVIQAADAERLTGGFDDFPGDDAQVVDLHDALDLSE